MYKISEIKELIKSFDKSGLSQIKIGSGENRLVMQKGGSMVAPAPQAQNIVVAQPSVTPSPVAVTAPTVSDVISGDTINSEMVGTYYASPSPESPAFIKVGDTIKKGQTLCILEAMKIMNEIEAEFDCKILDILVEDGSPVEYDMPLFAIEKL